MADTVTITLPGRVKSILETITEQEGIPVDELINAAIEEYLFFRQLRLLRQRMIAKAQAQGIYSEEDIFDQIS
ncbi:MAG: hypothetical protein D6784_05775 [Chloroflexi bacterium]|nr:MAG: hypothetical protein D6784_05775 [Chloroflexota bacterium]